MAHELGTGYIIISPSTKGLGKAIEGSIGEGTNAGTQKSSKTLLQRIGGAFGKIGKIGIAATTAVGGALVGLAAKGGFDRALNIERAQTKLKALGHDTRSVDGIMNDALASVKGTAFGLGDAASVAAGLVASGVKQGGQLQTVLKTVGDTAQIAGVEFKDMGVTFGKVAATGRLQGDEMLQLMEAGIPVLQYLADHFHVTAEEAQKMVSDGKVSFADFEAAMREHVGGAALSAGESFAGAMANVKAALSRLGESVATPVIKGLTGLFNQAIPLIDGFTAAAKPMLEHIGDSLQHGLEQVIPAIGGVVSTIGSMLDGLRRGLGGAFSTLGDALHPAANKIKNTFLTLFAGIKNQVDGDVGSMTDGIGVKIQGFAAKIAPALGNAALHAAEAFQNLMPSVQQVIDFISNAFNSVKDIVGQFFSAFEQAGGSTAQLSQIGGALVSLMSPLGAIKLVAEQFGSIIMPTLSATLGQLAGTLGGVLASVLPSIASAFETAGSAMGQVLSAGCRSSARCCRHWPACWARWRRSSQRLQGSSLIWLRPHCPYSPIWSANWPTCSAVRSRRCSHRWVQCSRYSATPSDRCFPLACRSSARCCRHWPACWAHWRRSSRWSLDSSPIWRRPSVASCPASCRRWSP